MKTGDPCPTCRAGTLTHGPTTMTLSRGETTIVIHEVPAFGCDQCAERIVESQTQRRLDALMANAVHHGVVHQVAHYQRYVA